MVGCSYVLAAWTCFRFLHTPFSRHASAQTPAQRYIGLLGQRQCFQHPQYVKKSEYKRACLSLSDILRRYFVPSAAVYKTQTKYRRLRMPSQRGVFEIFSTGCGEWKEFAAKVGSCGKLAGCKLHIISNLYTYSYRLRSYTSTMSALQSPVLHGLHHLKCNIVPDIVY